MGYIWLIFRNQHNNHHHSGWCTTPSLLVVCICLLVVIVQPIEPVATAYKVNIGTMIGKSITHIQNNINICDFVSVPNFKKMKSKYEQPPLRCPFFMARNIYKSKILLMREKSYSYNSRELYVSYTFASMQKIPWVKMTRVNRDHKNSPYNFVIFIYSCRLNLLSFLHWRERIVDHLYYFILV